MARRKAIKKKPVKRKPSMQARIARDLNVIASGLRDLNQRANAFEEAMHLLARGMAPLIHDLRRRPGDVGFDPDDFVVFDDLVARATKGWRHGTS